MLSRELQQAIVREANRAPSVHNTQPTRWSFRGNQIILYVDESRLLDVGDPTRQDAGVSCGAALEGTAIALSRHRMGIQSVEDRWGSGSSDRRSGLTIAARLSLREVSSIDPLASFVEKRFTWRGSFDPAPESVIDRFAEWSTGCDSITFVSGGSDLADIADLNDAGSLGVFRDRPYREELLSYMRLSRKHPRSLIDGLNLDAMQLSSLEGYLAGLALRHPVFEGIDALGLSRMIVSERSKTLTASGVAFFSMPIETSPITAGRAFYRCWLHFTRLGVAAWPMAVLADDPQTAELCKSRFAIPATHRLINAFRVGAVDARKQPAPARLPVDELIVD